VSPLDCSRQAGGHSEGNILQLIAFRGEEVDGAITTQKIRGEFSNLSGYTATAATLHVHAKSGGAAQRNTKRQEPFCTFCDSRGHWAQDCTKVTDIAERIEWLKTANRCFLCLIRRNTASNCGKRVKVKCAKCKKLHHISICYDRSKTRALTTQTHFTSV
jgi:hypothetical protein